MTQVWRKMQGVKTHQSCSEAEYLQIEFYLSLFFDLEKHENRCKCRYTIYGDTIETKFFEDSDEALTWIHDKVLEELEMNIRAIQEKEENNEND